MSNLLNKFILKLPSWIISLLNTSFSRKLYVELHQLGSHRSDMVIDGVNSTFYCPNRESWKTINIKFEQERPIVSQIMDYITEKNYSTFYDIGANIGSFSCFLGQEVDKTIVFEPYEPNTFLLEKNLDINNINSRVENVAIGNRNGSVKLNIPISEEPGTEQSTILKSHPLEHDFINHVEVEVVRLDDYIVAENLPKPDLIKIDIEGAGLRALKGLSTVLTENNPDIFIETHNNSEEIANFLKKHGYRLNYISANRNDRSPTIIAE